MYCRILIAECIILVHNIKYLLSTECLPSGDTVAKLSAVEKDSERVITNRGDTVEDQPTSASDMEVCVKCQLHCCSVSRAFV